MQILRALTQKFRPSSQASKSFPELFPELHHFLKAHTTFAEENPLYAWTSHRPVEDLRTYIHKMFSNFDYQRWIGNLLSQYKQEGDSQESGDSHGRHGNGISIDHFTFAVLAVIQRGIENDLAARTLTVNATMWWRREKARAAMYRHLQGFYRIPVPQVVKAIQTSMSN
ncbi:MAG: hypothetical protein HY731_07855 [Candidatus Tectomicrobia bacterium]|nr:hypothetical protein [Candidatus Tectomicrobia bacterium]